MPRRLEIAAKTRRGVKFEMAKRSEIPRTIETGARNWGRMLSADDPQHGADSKEGVTVKLSVKDWHCGRYRSDCCYSKAGTAIVRMQSTMGIEEAGLITVESWMEGKRTERRQGHLLFGGIGTR